MERDSLIMEVLAAQRTAALDQLAIRTADLAVAKAELSKLQQELDKLKKEGATGGDNAPA